LGIKENNLLELSVEENKINVKTPRSLGKDLEML